MGRPAPADRSDLVALGRWVADCLDDKNHLVWRTVVNGLVDEVERHRRANLVRCVLDSWDEARDGGLIDYVNEHGWDAVPWKIAESAIARPAASGGPT